MTKICMIEDDFSLGTELKKMLEYFQYDVMWFQNGKDMLIQSSTFQGDIYLIDIMLPDISGFDLCAKIRERERTPIIIITALDNEKDIIYGFQQGANDYVVKPFSFQILNMRIKALLNLYHHSHNQYILCDELLIDLENKTVIKNHEKIKLRKIEFEILNILIQHTGKICSRDFLLEYLYSLEDIEEATLTVHISRLRKAIGKAYIDTIYGYGYRWAKELNEYEEK